MTKFCKPTKNDIIARFMCYEAILSAEMCFRRLIDEFKVLDDDGHIIKFPNWSTDTPGMIKKFTTLKMSDTQFLLVSLGHVERWAKELKSTEFAAVKETARKFRATYTSSPLRDLRDLIEHQEDYWLGRGRKPHLLKQEAFVAWGVHTKPGAQRPTVTVAVFGNRFDLTDVMGMLSDLRDSIEPTLEANQLGP